MNRYLVWLGLGLVVWVNETALAQNRPYRASRNPAAQIMRRPTVSPYLNLLRPSGIGQVPNYQTIVRPELEQRRLNQQQGAEIQQLQREAASQRRATADLQRRDRSSQPGIRGTGHQTSTLNLNQRFDTHARRDGRAFFMNRP